MGKGTALVGEFWRSAWTSGVGLGTINAFDAFSAGDLGGCLGGKVTAGIQPLAYWSRWKAAALAIATAAIAAAPVLPGTEPGWGYTAFFFTPIGSPIRIGLCACLALISLIVAIMAIAANLHRLAVWTDGATLYWRAVTVRRLSLAEIKSVRLDRTGVIRIQRKSGGRPVEIAASLLRSPADIEAVLRVLGRYAAP